MKELKFQTRREEDVLALFKVVQSIGKINEALRCKSNNEVDIDIFYKLMNLINDPRIQFNDSQIERYFRVQNQLEQLRNSLEGFQDAYFNLPTSIEYRILGLTYDEMEELQKAPYDDDFDGVYAGFYLAFIQGRMRYQDFIQSIKIYLESCKRVKRTS